MIIVVIKVAQSGNISLINKMFRIYINVPYLEHVLTGNIPLFLVSFTNGISVKTKEYTVNQCSIVL